MSSKERTPAFLFYPKQFTGDDAVQAMDLDVVGAHILLMSSAAASPERCRIHADEHAIRNRLRNPSEQDWHRIRKQLLAGAWKVTADGQWWEQDGLRRTFQKQQKLSESQREKANKRWKEDYAQPMPDECRTNAASDAEGDAQKCLAVAVAFPVTDTVQNQNQNHTAEAVDVSSSAHLLSAKSKATAKKEPIPDLPEWITSNPAILDAWEGFTEMRKATKQRMTGKAISLAIAKLDELRRKGDDPVEVLNQSTLNNYRGIFPLKREHGKTNGKIDHIDIAAINHSAGREKRADGSLVF